MSEHTACAGHVHLDAFAGRKTMLAAFGSATAAGLPILLEFLYAIDARRLVSVQAEAEAHGYMVSFRFRYDVPAVEMSISEPEMADSAVGS